jgi:PAS domain S-box-containing protein
VDPGFNDRTGIIFGYWNFESAKLVVEDECLLEQANTNDIAHAIIQKEKLDREHSIAQEMYWSLFNNSPLPMWIIDDEREGIILANDAATQVYGYTLTEYLQMNFRQLFYNRGDGTGIPRGFCNLDTRNTYEHLCKDGSVLMVRLGLASVSFNTRKADLMLAIDVTEAVERMRQIEEQNLALKEIAWIQSHVVRAPLATLLGLVNLLKYKDEMYIDESELVANIMTTADELDEVIHAILRKAHEEA